jgi:translation initiation factor IF-2
MRLTIAKKPALKVHQLAKELGVNSKEILARCKAEEIPDITTHLSPVSVGLAQTIREWFRNAQPSSEAVADAAASAPSATAVAAPPAPPAPPPAKPAAKTAGEGVAPGKAHKKVSTRAAEPETSTSAAHSGSHADKKAASADAPAVADAHDARTAEPKSAHESRAVEASAAQDAKLERKAEAPREAHREAPQSTAPEGHADGKPAARTSTDGGATADHSGGTVPTKSPDAGPQQSASPSSGEGATAPDAPARPARAAGVPAPIPSASFQRPSASTRPPVVSHRPQGPGSASASAGPRERPPVGGGASGVRGPAGRTPQATPQTGSLSGPSVGQQQPEQMGGDGDQVSFEPTAPPVMNIPKRPDIVKPVGPKLEAPVKSALSGPKVIRIEAPEQLPAPRPRSATGTGTGGPMRVGRTGGGTTGRPDDRRGRRDDTGRSGRLARAGGAGAGEPWRDQDLREREARLSKSEGYFKSHRRDANAADKKQGGGGRVEAESNEPVRISEPITIKELSAATGVKAADILRKLFLGGTMMTINSAIDAERAMEVMMDFDIELVVEESKSAAEIIEARFADREKIDVRPRAPVVTILGHVDHGKTSLLDKIRNANVAAGEAGGITQATSAFQVPVKAGDKDRVVTFIDTPGHEAFTNMRSRGAKVTDIVVLVIAADDGVMPQTVESISHAKAAGVPIVVALNKIDKPEATESNIRRILGQLAEHELNPVEWGGTVEVVRTSATKNIGIQDLLDILDYQADLLGLTADFGGTARGTVLEAKMEEGRGPVANVIVQEGTLKKGDFIVVGRGFGRVRDIVTDRAQRTAEAIPSTPVAISGLDLLPDAGDKFYVVETLKAAEEAAEERRRIDRERELAAPKITLDNIFQHLEKGQRKELSLVVKGDVQGSVETLRAVLSKISTDEVAVGVRHCAVGGINESDIALAEATKSIIVGFNVTSSAKARSLAEAKGIEIRLYDVIYDLTDDVTKAAAGLLAPELKLEVLGHAEVRQAFKISKVGMIAGCYVLDGTIERNAQIRVTRGGIVVEKDRRLEQLKRFKDDAKEVRAGQECGMKIAGYDDIKVGDILECYKTITVARSL